MSVRKHSCTFWASMDPLPSIELQMQKALSHSLLFFAAHLPLFKAGFAYSDLIVLH